MKKSKEKFDHCPRCLFNFLGLQIPKKDRRAFGGAKYFRNEISLYDRDLDRTVGYKCPNCEFAWKC